MEVDWSTLPKEMLLNTLFVENGPFIINPLYASYRRINKGNVDGMIYSMKLTCKHWFNSIKVIWNMHGCNFNTWAPKYEYKDIKSAYTYLYIK